MDSELVTGSESDKRRNGADRSSFIASYTEYFNQLCPFYLNAGMTYEQFWDGDSSMVRAFRKAHDMRLEEDNFKMWLQGKYFYDALCCVAPIFRAFSKAKKPIDYHDQPFMLKNEYSEIRKKQAETESDNKARAMLEAFAEKFNQKFKEKKGG